MVRRPGPAFAREVEDAVFRQLTAGTLIGWRAISRAAGRSVSQLRREVKARRFGVARLGHRVISDPQMVRHWQADWAKEKR